MPPINPYKKILSQFNKNKVNYLVIGVSAINYYSQDPGTMFSTQDCDFLVKPNPKNLVHALKVLYREGYKLESNGEQLGPIDLWLASKIIEHGAMITARKGKSLNIDIVTNGGNISYKEWEQGRKTFKVGNLKVWEGNLPQLIQAKENSGREKDKKFLALYKIQLKEMLKKN